MKVQVQINSKTNVVTLPLVVSPSDTVLSIKERIAIVEPLPASFQEIVLGGTSLEDSKRLSECGVQEGSVMNVVVQNVGETLTQQLTMLLQAGNLPLNELDFMYTYKHGINTRQVLQMFGHDGQLSDFLKDHKKLAVLDGVVTLKRETPAVEDSKECTAANEEPLKVDSPPGLSPVLEKLIVVISVTLLNPAVPNNEDSAPINLVVRGDETVASVKERAAAAQQIPFPDRDLSFGKVVLLDSQQVSAAGVKDGTKLNFIVRATEGAFILQLTELLQVRPSSPHDLSLRYNYRHGASVTRAMRIVGLVDKFQEFVKRQPCFLYDNGCISLKVQMPPGLNGAPHVGVEQILERAMAIIVQSSFLRVVHHVAAPTAKGDATIEAVLFLYGVGSIEKGKWLPGVLRATASGLRENMPWLWAGVVGDAVRVRFDHCTSADVRFAAAD